MENNIPTAEEFLNNLEEQFIKTGKPFFYKDALKEFAKLHVKAALKEASSQAHWDGSDGVNIKSILNSYPLTLIQ